MNLPCRGILILLALVPGLALAAPRLRGGDSNAPWLGEFVAERVVAASSPDNTFATLRDLIDSARHSIEISVYQLDNPFLGDALEHALDRGVSVRVLIEGMPIPKLPDTVLYVARELARKGARVYFYDAANGRDARQFKYFHAKYTIVDDRAVVVGSANYGNRGHPVNTTYGNREWELVVHDARAAALFHRAFEHDLALKEEWAEYGSSKRYTLADPDYEPGRTTRGGRYSLALRPATVWGVGISTVFAPDNSLEPQGAMLGALRAARDTVDIEQLTFETYWGDKPYNPEREDSPLVSLVLALARAGRAVRVLMNDDAVFREPDRLLLFSGWLWGDLAALPDALAVHGFVTADRPSGPKPPRDNLATMKELAKIARREGLALSARLLNYRACGLAVLHNKGMIVDGQVTFLGSLNWGESALKFNREAGVVVRSRDVAAYYQRAFDHDWRCSR